jgi:fucose permease
MALLVSEVLASSFAFRNDTAEEYHSTTKLDDELEHPTTNPFLVRATWLCATYFFVYVGIEGTPVQKPLSVWIYITDTSPASISDWIPLYQDLIAHLPLTYSALSSSSFWAGMAVGRLTLGFITQRYGLPRSVSAYIILSATFTLALSLLPGSAPSFLSLSILAMLGYFCGPLFPSGILELSSKVKRESVVSAVAAAAGMGQVGAAVAPLIIGFLADLVGLGHFIDVLLGMLVILLGIWVLFVKIG